VQFVLRCTTGDGSSTESFINQQPFEIKAQNPCNP